MELRGMSLFAGAAALMLAGCNQQPESIMSAVEQSQVIAAAPTSYSTSFDLTEDPISEGGMWINGQSVGLDWHNVRTVSGRATGENPPSQWWTDATAVLAGTWGPDQVATATVYCPSAVPDNTELELRLRSSISANNCRGYECLFNCSTKSTAYMMIVRWNGPEQDYEILNQAEGSSYGVKHGDVIKGTVIGNVITMYVNGVQKLQATDNVYTTGAPGIGLCNAATVAKDSWGLSDFSVTCTGGSTNTAPTVATVTAASPSTVTAKTSNLSVLGADNGGEAALTYTWAATTVPSGGTATFSANGTNAAKNTTATFNKAGSYTLRATITDAGALTVTSSVNVTVSQTLTTIALTPATASVATSGTQQFTASAKDQFGTALTTQPSFTWSRTGVGSISTSGLFSAGATAGTTTVTASSGGKSGTASVTVAVAGSVSDTLEVTNGNAKYSLTAMTSPAGFRGTRYERFNGTSDSAQWNHTIATAGTYTLTFRYLANPGTGTLALKVNGTTVNSAVNFHSGTSNTWNTVAQSNVSLVSGVNRICLKGGAASPNYSSVDYMVIRGGGPANQPPTVATAASANPATVTAKTSALSVLGSDDGGEAALTYTWAATTVPSGGAATFSVNGTNAAKSTVATFTKAGSYTLQATIKDAGNLTVTSSVSVTVSQTLTTITVAPSSAGVAVNATQQFTASAVDQFGAAMTATYTWTVSGGAISTSGLFTAGATAGGPYTVTATSGSKSGTASVTVTAGSASHTIKVTALDDGFTLDKFEYLSGSTWTAVDANSAGITYSGTWNTGTCTDNVRTNTGAGNYAQFVFTGAGIRVYSNGGTETPFTVRIDGTLQATVSPAGTGSCNTKEYEKTGL